MHKINQLEIELRTAGEDTGEAMLARVGRIYAPSIAPAIEGAIELVCNELGGGGGVDAIESLELDLGVIAESAFESDFVDRLVPALRAALSAALRERRRSPRGARASLELVEVFALTGCLPWWADDRDPHVVADHVARAAEAAGDELIGMLRRIGGDRGVLERIARHCDEHVVRLLWQRTGAAGDLPHATDARVAALAAVIDPSMRASASAAAAKERARDRRALAQAHATKPEPAARDAARAGERTGTELSAVATPAGRPLHVAEPAPEIDSLGARARPARDRDQIEDTGEHALGGRTQAQRDRAPVQPAPGDGAAAMRGDGAAPRVGDPDARARRDGPPAEPRAVPQANESLARRAAAARPAAEPSAAAHVRRRALASLDEVYVADAGLVILWPFFERLFARVALLGEDRRFVDDDAAMQAVALVETLAVPDSELLEFQLPLAKLLCGRALESDFVLAGPLAPILAAEGEHMLAAVLDHVRTLGELSIAGFRQTFLQRRGALTTRDGAWLLRVERHTHDVLLDRFPWSWSWVKLPWMPDPLRVEW